MYASALSQSGLARRIAFPTPEAAEARAALKRRRACRQAQRKLAGMQQRLLSFRHDRRDLAALSEIAEEAAPDTTESAAWPADIRELAEKIQREGWGTLEATEAPVRNADRELVLRGLPPCVEVNRDDVRYTQ